MDRASIRWTETAKNRLKPLPKPIRRGLLDAVNRLRESHDPRAGHKPVTGPLVGLYRVCYQRYRAVYTFEEDHLSSGDCLVNIVVRFVAEGRQKEGDKKDMYRLAKKLVDMGLIDVQPDDSSSESGD